MAGIEEVRANLGLAKEKLPFGALNQAKLDFEEASQLVAQATQGSSQDEIQQAAGQLQLAMENVTQVLQIAMTVEQTIEGYEGRL